MVVRRVLELAIAGLSLTSTGQVANAQVSDRRRARSICSACFALLCILALSFSFSCRYAYAAGEVTYDYTQRIPVGAGLNSVLAIDVDDDDRADLAYSRGGSGFDTGDVGILLGKGDGTFDDIDVVPIDFRPGGLQMADVDNDGILDIVVTAAPARFSTDRLISVTPGNGDGTFDTTRTKNTPLAVFVFSFQLADIDNDDNLDFYFVDRNNQVVIVYPGNGDGMTSETVDVLIVYTENTTSANGGAPPSTSPRLAISMPMG